MSDLKRLGNIDKDTKFTIYGYIRENQPFFASAEYNIFNNIPDLVPSLCILYFDCGDIFEIIGNGLVYVDNDRSTVLMQKKILAASHCFGSVIVSSKSNCICKWDLKMINIPQTVATSIVVGIASTRKDGRLSGFNLGDQYYIYSNYRWCRDHIGSRNRDSDDGGMTKYFSGDIVTITLDMVKKTVTFYNHTSKLDLSIDMTDTDKFDYRLAVAIRQPNTSICIDKFTQKFLD